MEYEAIDFQSATRWHNSACSVALVTVKDGKIIDTFYSMIRPGILHFDKENTALHGITKEMVKDEPYFYELWTLIKEKFNGNNKKKKTKNTKKKKKQQQNACRALC